MCFKRVSKEFQSVSKEFPKGFKRVSKEFKSVSKGFPKCFKTVSREFQSVSKGFPKCFKRVSKEFQSVSKGFPKGFKPSETRFPKGFTATSNPLENAFVDKTCFRMEGHMLEIYMNRTCYFWCNVSAGVAERDQSLKAQFLR